MAIPLLKRCLHFENLHEAELHRSKKEIKADILKMAKSFRGKGDPDFSKQNQLNALVEKLLQVSPQPPIKDRIQCLAGPWHQVWGPYDYRNKKRGIDPTISPDDIYQVVFEGGYYYNVNPQRKRDKIGLLRGEYQIVSQSSNFLKVRFTAFPATSKNTPYALWELPALAEAGQLKNQSSIVPTFIVRLFFGGGVLREVYTDEDLRITYGADSVEDRKNEFIYIMERPAGTGVDPI